MGFVVGRWNLRVFFLVLALVLLPLASQAKDVWHQGHIEYTHTLAPVVHGVVPPSTHLVLDDGTNIEVTALAPDDVFRKLVAYWSTERTDYRAYPPFVDQFAFRLKGTQPVTGLRIIEINYTANDMYGHRWKGTTSFIK